MTNSDCRALRWPIVLAAAALVAGIGVAACSGKGGQSASPPASTQASITTTVMIDGNKHTMVAHADCSSSAAQPSATPPESGDLTTRISVYDDSASVSIAVSDEKPPSVDGFSILLKVGNGQYQIPYQAPQTATQVQATKDGKSYTVTGTAQAATPGQDDARPVTFGVHVTCA